MNEEELKQRLERAEKALEQIEEIYIDGSDTYQDWLDMGEIARNYFYEEEKSNSYYEYKEDRKVHVFED